MNVDGDYSYEPQHPRVTSGVTVEGFVELVRIGEGGFSVVYSAFQPSLNRRVAIKVLNISGPNRRQFENECKTLGPLTGVRGVVPILQTAYTGEGRPCIVMHLMAGGSLSDRLERSGPLSADEAIWCGRELAAALGEAHDRGISHRDVKPENVLIDADGSVGIADFGIALVEDLVAASMVASSLSPAHAPPERFLEGESASRSASDVYSLGSTLYQALSGRAPFGTHAQGGVAGLMNRIIGDDVPPIGRPEVPLWLDDFLRTAMAKRPEDRYPTMAAFAQALAAGPAAQRVTVDQTATVTLGSPSPPSYAAPGIPPGATATSPSVAPGGTAMGGTPRGWSPGATVDGRTMIGGPPAIYPDADFGAPIVVTPPAVAPRTSLTPLLAAIGVVVAIIAGVVLWRMSADDGTTTPTEPSTTEAKPPAFVDGVHLNTAAGNLVFAAENPNDSKALEQSFVLWEVTKEGDDAVLESGAITDDPDPANENAAIVLGQSAAPGEVILPIDATAGPYCVTLRLKILGGQETPIASAEPVCSSGS